VAINDTSQVHKTYMPKATFYYPYI